MSYQVDKDKQFNLDLSVYSSSGTERFPQEVIDKSTFTTEEKAALEATIPSPGTENHYLYAFQWISSNTFVERDLHVLGFRFAQTITYDEFTMYVNSRLPPVRNWNPRPRFSISQRNFAVSNSDNVNPNAITGSLLSIKPSIKIDYRWKKAWLFDIDFSVEYLDYSDVENRDGFRESIRLSYHYTF